MLAIVEAYRAGLLNRKNWVSNIGAGLIVGVVALPLAMAFAIASGAQPEQGLYTAIVAALFVIGLVSTEGRGRKGRSGCRRVSADPGEEVTSILRKTRSRGRRRPPQSIVAATRSRPVC